MRIAGYLFGLLQLACMALPLAVLWQSMRPTRGANMILMALPLVATIAVLVAVCQVVLLRNWRSSFSPLERVVLQGEAIVVLILAAAGVAFGLIEGPVRPKFLNARFDSAEQLRAAEDPCQLRRARLSWVVRPLARSRTFIAFAISHDCP